MHHGIPRIELNLHYGRLKGDAEAAVQRENYCREIATE
jgi:hypothetical protein